MVRWPSERENLEISLEKESRRSIEERFRDILELLDFARAFPARPDPIGDEAERLGNECLRGWIRAHRERP